MRNPEVPYQAHVVQSGLVLGSERLDPHSRASWELVLLPVAPYAPFPLRACGTTPMLFVVPAVGKFLRVLAVFGPLVSAGHQARGLVVACEGRVLLRGGPSC